MTYLAGHYLLKSISEFLRRFLISWIYFSIDFSSWGY